MRSLSIGNLGLVFTLTVSGLLAPSPAWAQEAEQAAKPQVSDEEAKALIGKVQERFKDVSTMYAKFEQVDRNEVFGDETTEGEVHIKRPAMMRWAYGADKQFISNGKKLWVYTASDRQVMEYDDISSSRSAADELLGSLDKLDQHFAVTVLSSDASGHALELRPKETAQFKKIGLTLDKELIPAKIVMTDTFGAVTELTFTQVELNKPMEEAMFNFTPPAGVDVIKATN